MAKILMPRPRTKRRGKQLFNVRRGLFYALYPNPTSEPDDEGPQDAAEDAAEGMSEASEP